MENSVQLIYAGRTNLNASIGGIGLLNSSKNPTKTSSRMSNETESRARVLADRMSEVARILANEPSLALYRIEEHVRKTVPRLAAQRADVAKLDRDIAGHVTDVDCVLSALRSIGRSRSSFQSIGELSRNALFTKQQLDYERRRRSMAASVTDAIKRSSADVVQRLSSSDLPTAPAAGEAPDTPSSTSSININNATATNSSNLSGSMLESARTFLRSKTIDYSQNLIRRAQTTKSVEIPAGIDFSQAPPPPPPTPSLPHMPAPTASLAKPQRSSSAQLLKLNPVSESEETTVPSQQSSSGAQIPDSSLLTPDPAIDLATDKQGDCVTTSSEKQPKEITEETQKSEAD